MKRAYVAVFLFILCAALVSGCLSQAQLPKNATFGGNFYDFNNVHSWKYGVVMAASGVNSTWNMTTSVKNDQLNGTPARYMQVLTEGNGMNITYDVWSNATTYNILRMHAKGDIGGYFQDRDTSSLQIFTLPDIGLSYYYVPFMPVENYSVTMPNGGTIPVTIYTATNNNGFTVTYWIYKGSPVPLRVEMTDKNFKISETLLEYN